MLLINRKYFSRRNYNPVDLVSFSTVQINIYFEFMILLDIYCGTCFFSSTILTIGGSLDLNSLIRKINEPIF